MKLTPPSTNFQNRIDHNYEFASEEIFRNRTITNFTVSSESDVDSSSNNEKGKHFMIIVIISFCIFFGFIIIFVVYDHYKKVTMQKKKEEAKLKPKESQQATISKKTSLVGSGQKQLIIERKVSVNARKISQGSRGSNGHVALGYLRSLSESSSNQNGSDVTNESFQGANKNELSNYRRSSISSKSFQMIKNDSCLSNGFLDNVLIRYRSNSVSVPLKNVPDVDEPEEDQDENLQDVEGSTSCNSFHKKISESDNLSQRKEEGLQMKIDVSCPESENKETEPFLHEDNTSITLYVPNQNNK